MYISMGRSLSGGCLGPPFISTSSHYFLPTVLLYFSGRILDSDPEEETPLESQLRSSSFDGLEGGNYAGAAPVEDSNCGARSGTKEDDSPIRNDPRFAKYFTMLKMVRIALLRRAVLLRRNIYIRSFFAHRLTLHLRLWFCVHRSSCRYLPLSSLPDRGCRWARCGTRWKGTDRTRLCWTWTRIDPSRANAHRKERRATMDLR